MTFFLLTAEVALSLQIDFRNATPHTHAPLGLVPPAGIADRRGPCVPGGGFDVLAASDCGGGRPLGWYCVKFGESQAGDAILSRRKCYPGTLTGRAPGSSQVHCRSWERIEWVIVLSSVCMCEKVSRGNGVG